MLFELKKNHFLELLEMIFDKQLFDFNVFQSLLNLAWNATVFL